MQTTKIDLSEQTVAELLITGVRLVIIHNRKIILNGVEKLVSNEDIPALRRHFPVEILPRGGSTEITLTLKSGAKYVGKATCNPKEGFCYKTGVKEALKRLELK